MGERLRGDRRGDFPVHMLASLDPMLFVGAELTVSLGGSHMLAVVFLIQQTGEGLTTPSEK